MARKSTPGVTYRHSRNCTRETCTNNCNTDSVDGPWEGWVFDAKYVDPETGTRGKKIRKRFATHAAAKGWRADALGAVSRRKLQATDRATAQKTLRQEVDEWMAGARAGTILNKRERPYKPAVLRNYELSLRLRVLPTLGDRRLSDIGFVDLLRLKEQLIGDGCTGSTLRNTFVPLQAIYRRARLEQRVIVDPTMDLPLPTAGSRDRAATPKEAVGLIEATAEDVRPLLATAFYSGLRRGELRGLRVGDVDIETQVIQVRRSWDDKEGEITPKSDAGTRTVLLPDALKPYLEPLVEGRADGDLVFGRGADTAFDPRAIARKAERAWTALDEARRAKWEEAGAEQANEPTPLVRFTFHEARHSFSTWLDHAGISEARADRYMGHSSGKVSGRYRHLLPTRIADDRAKLDAYLTGAIEGKVVAIRSVGLAVAPAADSPAVGAA